MKGAQKRSELLIVQLLLLLRLKIHGLCTPFQCLFLKKTVAQQFVSLLVTLKAELRFLFLSKSLC
jgi:hypothetical protein